MRIIGNLLALGGLAITAACSDNEFLRGERIEVRPASTVSTGSGREAVRTFANVAFSVPPTEENTDWTHISGGPAHTTVHPAFSSAPKPVWDVSIGQGNSRRHRITAGPVVSDRRVFALDSQALLTAVTVDGTALWSRDLTPSSERGGDASGGGLAAAYGRVYATTGFGEVVALDAATGREIWRQDVEAPATGGLTVAGGLVYMVTRASVAWAIDAENGRVGWRLPGTPVLSGTIGGASPAVTDRIAVIPFGVGELVAVLRQGGAPLWSSVVSGRRQGRAYANSNDITADPVVSEGVVYSGNRSGRAVALRLNTGERLWTVRDGAQGPVSVSGGSVFLISDLNELIRLDAATGARIWSRELKYFRNEKASRHKAIHVYFGPALAGGGLWLASNDGTVTSYNPETGARVSTFELPGGAASSMAFADGTMYIVSDRGRLHAYR